MIHNIYINILFFFLLIIEFYGFSILLFNNDIYNIIIGIIFFIFPFIILLIIGLIFLFENICNYFINKLHVDEIITDN